LPASGCSGKPDGYHYSIAERKQAVPGLSLTMTLVQRFEKKHWCEANAARMSKEGFRTACRYEEGSVYEPMFRGEPAGKWYVHQSIGRFSPSLLIYESTPSLPDDVMIRQLEQTAPHILKFAALHRAPAQVRIFSPEKEIPRGL